MDNLFLRGLLLGLAIAAPVGPIGVLVIRRTLAEGRLVGLVSGLGAATADAFYGCLAAFGLTLISELLIRQGDWLRIMGGIFLCYLGVRTFLSVPSQDINIQPRRGLPGAFASTFLLTLTNPITILSFAAIFAGLGLSGTGRYYLSAAWLVVGVFCGSALWWLLLSTGVGLFRRRITPQAMRWINRLAGMIIFAFGLAAFISLGLKV
jgi:threonine/homoserine/homoserine lactone efflux protein